MKNRDKIAIWAVTPNGVDLAEKIAGKMEGANLFFLQGLPLEGTTVRRFSRLRKGVAQYFNQYPAHIFIMSAGIAVRVIAPLIRHKTEDPAVLVIDEKGHHVISLLSGHVGGANALTVKVARLIDSDPVITTATDINGVSAIDVLAVEKNLFIENPEAIKYVNMAMIKGDPVELYDPYDFLTRDLVGMSVIPLEEMHPVQDGNSSTRPCAGVFIDDIRVDLSRTILILRPSSLVAGIGCNRNTGFDELRDFLFDVLKNYKLSVNSLSRLVSIDLKSDEAGLLELAKSLDVPIEFFSKEQLNRIKTIQNPSILVEKHVGVKSVCEAAAILGSNQGRLIVPKQNTRNVTVAIARKGFTS